MGRADDHLTDVEADLSTFDEPDTRFAAVPTRGDVTLEIDGRPVTLRFDWDAIEEAHAQYGETIDTSDPRVLARMVAIGMLRHHGPEDWPDHRPKATAFMDEKAAWVYQASPPLLEAQAAVSMAYGYGYGGPTFGKTKGEAEPAEAAAGGKGRLRRLATFAARLFGLGLRPRRSGG